MTFICIRKNWLIFVFQLILITILNQQLKFILVTDFLSKNKVYKTALIKWYLSYLVPPSPYFYNRQIKKHSVNISSIQGFKCCTFCAYLYRWLKISIFILIALSLSLILKAFQFILKFVFIYKHKLLTFNLHL